MHAMRTMKMSIADFLAWDATQAERHEFVGGEVQAAPGPDAQHDAVVARLAAALRRRLAGGPWQVFAGDMRLHVADAFFYPDLLLTRARAGEHGWVECEPALLAEVLSPATADYDRHDKLAHYRLIPTLRHVLLVDPVARRAELHRREGGQRWSVTPLEAGDALVLPAVGSLPLASLLDEA